MHHTPASTASTNSDLHRLYTAAGALRFCDQIAVAGTPLVAATVFGAGPDLIGLMIAAQGSSWLLASLPAGVLIDRMDSLVAARRSLMIALAGFLVLSGGLSASSVALFTFGAFITACAAVVWFLAEQAAIQRTVQPGGLANANARIQMLQSVALLAGPALMGFLVARGWTLAAYAGAATLLLGGLVAAHGFSRASPQPARERAPLTELAEGLAFVRSQPLLRGIVACALFWNLAAFALAAIFVPYALTVLGLPADMIGLAQAGSGVGSIAAAALAGAVLARTAPRFVLLFGPASSVLAVLILLNAPASYGWAAAFAMQALLGFGPVLWFVCQTTIRQLVTPTGLLARVGAVIQVAIYGVRSVGALIGGLVAARFGLDAGLWLVVALFIASTLAVVFSPLGQLRQMPDAAR
jgi:predicted MFS family arabinose efflux permease